MSSFESINDNPCEVLHVRKGSGQQVGKVPEFARTRNCRRCSPGPAELKAVLLPAHAAYTCGSYREASQLQHFRQEFFLRVNLPC